jgi:hypothetical protein
VRTRLALLAAACAAVLATPASALAEDAQPSCLPAKGEISSAGMRGVRVGVKANIRDASGKPLNVTRVSYCVDGGGDFSFALTPESDVVLVLSTAEGDAIGPINPTSPALSARAEWPSMKKILRTQHSTVYRIDGRRQLILGVAAGRVAFIAAADRLLLEYPGKLGYYLKRLGF